MSSSRKITGQVDITCLPDSETVFLHLMPKPLVAGPSGFKPDGRLCWKLPEWENEEQGSDNVVRPKQIGMSRLYSPRSKMAFMPLTFEPMDDLPDFSSPLTRYFSLPHKLQDMVAGKQCSCNIVIIMNNEMSKEHSPDAKNNPHTTSAQSLLDNDRLVSLLCSIVWPEACGVGSRGCLVQQLIT